MACSAALHALLNKREPRSAFGWMAICLLFPAAGPILYVLFGINRVRTRARQLHAEAADRSGAARRIEDASERFVRSGTSLPAEYVPIARVADALTRRPLLAGNRVEPLRNGEQAYPAMLDAIGRARRSVYLSTYIFQLDGTGEAFVAALDAARRRGVDVRVIVDGFGELYALPRRAGTELVARGVRVTRFLPPRLLPPWLYVNLRNHRKILVADGTEAFTGGMNIADRHLCAEPETRARTSDLQFRVTGPVVGQLEQAFLDDWRFCTGDAIPSAAGWHGEAPAGDALCRVVAEGPNEDVNKIATIITAAIAMARHRLIIATPYFLPARDMIGALQTAALSGVEVILILPERNNLPYVHWATRNMLWELIDFGVQVCYQPPPFAHEKLFLVDDYYAQVGSANLDPRSLRLNFEINLEVYDRALVESLAAHADAARRRARPVTAAELERRPVVTRVRDAAAWLFSPYL